MILDLVIPSLMNNSDGHPPVYAFPPTRLRKPEMAAGEWVTADLGSQRRKRGYLSALYLSQTSSSDFEWNKVSPRHNKNATSRSN